ncbi:MAG TPA: hypothetical protein PLB12_07010 [Candidatus Goldiibacteriota bacterium]|nr:hypothetical protein [Candidatus Goldiibacteriota bacterium]HPN64191.1 hypothetical protein [Candidatus Goldiibacteriota bacterium]HRQ44084.1 hypothetical protein [Candidatus Goldiibacteriota bacterium]
MKKCVILLLIPILILSGCATVSPVSTNENHDIEEKELEQSAKQQEYVEDKVDKNIVGLVGAGVGLGCCVFGILSLAFAGLSTTQEQYDEATSKAKHIIIGGAALGVVSLVLYFTL